LLIRHSKVKNTLIQTAFSAILPTGLRLIGNVMCPIISMIIMKADIFIIFCLCQSLLYYYYEVNRKKGISAFAQFIYFKSRESRAEKAGTRDREKQFNNDIQCLRREGLFPTNYFLYHELTRDLFPRNTKTSLECSRDQRISSR